jgi:hypothetical protein
MVRSGMPRHGAISRMLHGAFCYLEREVVSID